MDLLWYSFQIIAPLLIYLVLGYVLKIIQLIDTPLIIGINKFSFRLTIPLILFYNIYRFDLSNTLTPALLLFLLVILPAIFFVFILFTHFLIHDNRKKSAIMQTFIRMNQTLFAIPLMLSMYGDSSLGIAAIVSAFIIPLTNIITVVVLTYYDSGTKLSIRNILLGLIKNPLIVATVLGFLTQLISLKIPSLFEGIISTLANMGTPLALIALGGSIDFSKLKHNGKYIAFGTILRLLVVPSIALCIAILLGIRGVLLGGLLCVLSAPTAVSSYQLAVQMNSDGELAGELVVSTTVFSMITIFGFITLFKGLGFI